MNTSNFQQKLMNDRESWQRLADHLVEQASMDSQADLALRMAQEKVGSIDRALRRVAAGTYEICDDCGARIEPERLEILIDSGCHTCATCAKASRMRKPFQSVRRVSHSVERHVAFAR